MSNDKFKNADGTLKAYALICGYTETAKCRDLGGNDIMDDLGQQVTVTLWHESDHFHVRRSDWFLLRDRFNLADHAWCVYDTLTEARQGFDAMKRGYLQLGPTGTVHSSQGEYNICMATGLVTDFDGEGECNRIVRFNLDEYFRCYRDEKRETTTEFDILDLGYWCIDHYYEQPEPGFRERVALGQ